MIIHFHSNLLLEFSKLMNEIQKVEGHLQESQPHKLQLHGHNNTTDTDLKSRAILTQLLDDQIDRNEDLHCENQKLQNEQKKLVQLLQIRSSQLFCAKQELSTLQRQPQQSEKQGNSDQSTALHSLITGQQNQEDNMEALKTNILEKEQEMRNVREYYSKAIAKLEQELQDCRNSMADSYQAEKGYEEELMQSTELIGRQKEKVQDLMAELEKTQKSSKSLRSQLQKVEMAKAEQAQQLQKMRQRIEDQEHQLKSLSNQSLGTLKQPTHLQNPLVLTQEHQDQLIAIEQHHQQQNQKIQRACSAEIKQIESQCMNKIEILTQSHRMILSDLQALVEKKQQEKEETERELNLARERSREILIKYQEQCEVVIELEESQAGVRKERDNLLQTVKELTRNQQQNYNSAKEAQTSYQSKISLLQEQNQTMKDELSILALQRTEEWNKNKRMEESLKKYQSSAMALQQEIGALKLEFGTRNQQFGDLEREAKLKDEEIDRLCSKLQKESERRENHIRKLKANISQLQASLTESENKLYEKENSIDEYREEARRFVDKLKEDLAKVVENREAVVKENKAMKGQVKEMENKLGGTMAAMQNKDQESRQKYEGVCERLQSMEEERTNFKALYEDTGNEAKRMKQKNEKLHTQNSALKETIISLEIEVEELKNDILDGKLVESEKEEMHRVTDQAYELKANIDRAALNLTKAKQQNTRLVNQIVGLENANESLAAQNTMYTHEMQMKREKIVQLEDKVDDLCRSLKERSEQLDSSMPYVNKILEEKKNLELDYERRKTEIKKLTNLLQMAKKSKAEEIIQLKNKVHDGHQYAQELKEELSENRAVIERFNRDKVNMLRDNTIREDRMKKLENDVARLKQELKESQGNCEKLMGYMEIADTAYQNSGADTFATKNPRRK